MNNDPINHIDWRDFAAQELREHGRRTLSDARDHDDETPEEHHQARRCRLSGDEVAVAAGLIGGEVYRRMEAAERHAR